ncbi:MAG: head-tail adaptor protein [Bacteroidia bacterium]
MRYKVSIQQLTTTNDGAGGTSATWSTLKTMFALIKVNTSGRLFIQGQEYVGTYYTITCRYNSFKYTSPIETYRLVLDPDGVSKNLKILTINNPDLLKVNLTITAIDNG